MNQRILAIFFTILPLFICADILVTGDGLRIKCLAITSNGGYRCLTPESEFFFPFNDVASFTDTSNIRYVSSQIKMLERHRDYTKIYAFLQRAFEYQGLRIETYFNLQKSIRRSHNEYLFRQNFNQWIRLDENQCHFAGMKNLAHYIQRFSELVEPIPFKRPAWISFSIKWTENAFPDKSGGSILLAMFYENQSKLGPEPLPLSQFEENDYFPLIFTSLAVKVHALFDKKKTSDQLYYYSKWLQAYNAGPCHLISRKNRPMYPETKQYVQRVFTYMKYQNLSTPYDQIIRTACRKNRLPENLIKAIILAESSFHPYSTSHKGAKGLMQIMEPTWQDMTRIMEVEWQYSESAQPDKNIEVGCMYLAWLRDQIVDKVVRQSLESPHEKPSPKLVKS